MPASSLWARAGEVRDIESLINILTSQKKSGSIQVTAVNETARDNPVQGTLLGGCLSVICSLSGTKYFPESLKDHILFLEDTGENPGRLIRHWNQLLQNGCLQQLKGVILGRFSEHDSDLSEDSIRREIASRSPVPCWMSDDFGHTSPNFPLVNGSQGTIKPEQGVLHWTHTTTGKSSGQHMKTDTDNSSNGAHYETLEHT